MKNMLYNKGQLLNDERWMVPIMAKVKDQQQQQTESVGARVAMLRKKSGYSQRDLARETGISPRMIAYYEKHEHPPTHMLPVLAKALNVTVDQILGLEKINIDSKKKDLRLWRRFSRIEKMPPQEKRSIIQVLDVFIEKEQLKERSVK